MADNDTNKSIYLNPTAMRRKYALHLLQQAGDASPVKHPLQALARAIQGGLGGYYMRQLEREELAKSNHDATMAPASGPQDAAAISPSAGSRVVTPPPGMAPGHPQPLSPQDPPEPRPPMWPWP